MRSRTDTALTLLAWGVVALCCLQVLLFPFGRDQGIYGAIGDAVLAGKMPYRDAWDFKPPGIFVVYWFAQVLFGKTMASIRIVEVCSLVGMVFAFRRLGRVVFGSELAGLFGGALAFLLHAELDFWHTAQPESFGGPLTVFALLLVMDFGVDPGRTSRARRTALLAAGALLGAAFLMKPPLGGAALVLAPYAAWREAWRSRSARAAIAPVLLMGVASVAPLALTAAWFVARGAWPALAWTLFEFTPGYTKLGWTGSPLGFVPYSLEEAVTGFSTLLPVTLALVLVPKRLHPRESEGLVVIGLIVLVHALGIALQAKFFPYHFGSTLPLLALAGGVGLEKARRLLARVPFGGHPAWLAAILWLATEKTGTRHVPGTFWERSLRRTEFVLRHAEPREVLDRDLYRAADFDLDNDVRAALAVVARSGPSDSIFVWGFEPHVYWFSGRRAASRYLYDVPQRALWQRERARTELLDDLRRDPPRVIVVEHNDYFRHVTGDDLDSHLALATFPELYALIARGYHYDISVDDLDLYVPWVTGR